MREDVIAKFLRIGVQFVQRAGLLRTPALWSSLRGPNMLAAHTGGASLGVTQRPRHVAGVRRKSCALAPEPAVGAVVQPNLRRQTGADGSAPEH